MFKKLQGLFGKANKTTVLDAEATTPGSDAKADCDAIDAQANQLNQDAMGHLQSDQTLLAIECFEQVTKLWPDDGQTLFNLGALYGQINDPEASIAKYREALSLEPEHFEAHGNLAYALECMGRLDEALVNYNHTLRIKPDDAPSHNNVGNYYSAIDPRKAFEHFTRAGELDSTTRKYFSNRLLISNYMPDMSAKAIYQAHIDYDRIFTEKASRRRDIYSDHDRLRIGYLSADFRKHPVAHFVEALFQHHDRTRFEIYAYYNFPTQDLWTNRIAGSVDHWRDISATPDHDAITLIESDEIDILIDLSGHTAHNRLGVFAARPATIQVSWLGYPGTTGLSYFDYYLTDSVCDTSGDEQYYSEKLVFLKEGFSCYTPDKDAPEIAALPANRNGYITFGSLNILCKLNAAVFDVWAQILDKTPNSKLLLFRNQLCGEIKQAVIEEFSVRGIDADRLDLRDHMENGSYYLNTYNDIDICLDPFPWNGHTTTCEAQWMGVPTISLYGDRHAGRICSSVLTQLGLEDLICDSPERYVGKAVSISQDLAYLAGFRASARACLQNSPLGDGAQFARSFESALLKIGQNK